MNIGIPKYFGIKIPKLLIYNKSNSQRGVYRNRCLYKFGEGPQINNLNFYLKKLGKEEEETDFKLAE